jgi:type I restriction enzyme S subunit
MIVRKVRVGDVLTLRRRAVTVAASESYREIGVRSFGRGIFHKEPVAGASLGDKRIFETCPGDLVISNVFAWEGAIAVAGEAERGLVGSHRFLTYMSDPGVADVRFLCYFFLSAAGLALIGIASPGAAGRNRTLGIDAFESLIVPLPDIDEQQRMASRLDALHHSRRMATPKVEHARRLIRALHDSLFLGEGAVVRIGDHLTLARIPVSIDRSRNYEQIGIRSFGRGLFHYPSTSGDALSKVRYFELPPSALVLSNIMAWEGAIAVSTVREQRCVASHRFLSYIPTHPEQVDVRYLHYFLLSSVGFPLVQRASPGTTARNHTLSVKGFENLRIPLPAIAMQRRIADLLDRAYDVLKRIELREKQFNALTASALDHALAGLA